MSRLLLIFIVISSLWVASANGQEQWFEVYAYAQDKIKLGYLYRQTKRVKRKGKKFIKSKEISYQPDSTRTKFLQQRTLTVYLNKELELEHKKTILYREESRQTIAAYVSSNAVIIKHENGKQAKRKKLDKSGPIYDSISGPLLKHLGKLRPGTRGELQVLDGEEIVNMSYHVKGRENISLGIGEFSTYVVEIQNKSDRPPVTMYCTKDGREMRFKVGDIIIDATTEESAKQLPVLSDSISDKKGKTLRAEDGSVEITLYGAMQEMDSREMTASNPFVKIIAGDPYREAFVMVMRLSKELGSPTLRQWYDTVMQRVSAKADVLRHTTPTPTTISGLPAMQGELHYKRQEESISCLLTVMASDSYAYSIQAWSSSASFEKNKPLLQKVARSFRELHPQNPLLSANSPILSADGKYQITPYGEMSATDRLHPTASMQMADRIRDLFVVILIDSKTKFAMPLSRLQSLVCEETQQNIQNVQISPTKSLKVNGFESYQTKIEGTIRNIGAVYTVTCIDTGEDFVRILAWGRKSNFSANKETLQKTIDSFRRTK